MKLSPEITLAPIAHGRALIAAQVRRMCTEQHFDCIAVDIPKIFQDDLGDAVDKLPLIQAIVAREVHTDLCCYMPVDPCDPAIEGVRQSLQNRIPCVCIGHDPAPQPPLPPLPDEYAITKIGFDVYSALCLQAIGNPKRGSDDDKAGLYIAERLHALSDKFTAILALVHFRRYARTVDHFYRRENAVAGKLKDAYRLSTHFIHPDHLYFALGELPFVTDAFEKERLDPFAAPVDIVTEIKNLFRETRDNYYTGNDRGESLSPVRIQAALTFLRNLTVGAPGKPAGLIPSLPDIIEAAKGVGGNAYAVRILTSAKYYSWLPFELGAPLLGVGIDRITLPENNETIAADNLFRDTALEWRTVTIRPDPSMERKKKYRYAWNPSGMCSHVPEDLKIERFNDHVRSKAKRIMVEESARHEKFTASVKDGIDVRETLRNWHTGSIHVKEIPPSRGTLDTLVIIFDEEHDGRYPNRVTWYAEHPEESTLSFYATDPFADLIGPGIARCRYGGLALLYPPKTIPDLFQLTSGITFPNLAAQLAYSSLLCSNERVVAYVAEKKPGSALRAMAARLKKHFVWIPLATFSEETIRRLRNFHILNGKEVRGWAARFIGEE